MAYDTGCVELIVPAGFEMAKNPLSDGDIDDSGSLFRVLHETMYQRGHSIFILFDSV